MMKTTITKFSLSQAEVISALLGDELVDCERISWSITEDSKELLIFLTGSKADAGSARKNVLDKDEKRLEQEERKAEGKVEEKRERRREPANEEEKDKPTRKAADKPDPDKPKETSRRRADPAASPTYFFHREREEFHIDEEGGKITEKMKEAGWQSISQGEYRVLKNSADKKAARDREKEAEARDVKGDPEASTEEDADENAGVTLDDAANEEDGSAEDGGNYEEDEDGDKKPTSLPQLAGILCNEKEFHLFLGLRRGDNDGAKEELYRVLDIESRRELGSDEKAAQKFRSLVSEYRRWLDGND